ncbi:MAG: PKD domain-containing protein, partial [Candidatus Diapherotrites archaeon]
MVELKRAVLACTMILLAFVFSLDAFAFNPTGIIVTPSDGVLLKGGSAVIEVQGEGIEQVKADIFILDGVKIYSTGWKVGSTINFESNYFIGQVSSGVVHYKVYAKGGGLEQLVQEGLIEVKDYTATTVPSPQIEAGVAEVGGSWQTITFSENFNNPVVVVKSFGDSGNPSTAKDLGHFLTPRIRNVKSDSFEIMLQQLGGGTFGDKEEVSYLVAEAGHYKTGGFEIEAGTSLAFKFSLLPVGLLLPGRIRTHTSFKPHFEKEPVIISSVTTFNGSDPVTTRNTKDWVNILFLGIPTTVILGDFTEGFTAIVDEPGWDALQYHAPEKVSYIAITPNVGVIGGRQVYVGNGEMVDEKAKGISFQGLFTERPALIADMQSYNGDDWAVVRYASLSPSSAKLLIAEKSGGNHWLEKVGYILVGPGEAPPLVAHFTATPMQGAPPLAVHFDGSGSTGAASYSWAFGDGTTGTGATIDHTYNSEGTFKARLTVTDGSGATTYSEKDIIVSNSIGLVANITADKTICTNFPCTFNFDASASTGQITNYEWDFGDSSQKESGATKIQVSHQYKTKGSYTVTLKISDAAGNSDTTTMVVGIGCNSNADCACGNGCFNGVCLNPLIAISKSGDQIVPFTGSQKDIVTVWTLSNAGSTKAIVKDFWVKGCEGYNCRIEIVGQGGQIIAPNSSAVPSNSCQGGTSPAPTPAPGASPAPAVSPTPTPNASPTPTPSPGASPTPGTSPSPTPSGSPTPSPTPAVSISSVTLEKTSIKQNEVLRVWVEGTGIQLVKFEVTNKATGAEFLQKTSPAMKTFVEPFSSTKTYFVVNTWKNGADLAPVGTYKLKVTAYGNNIQAVKEAEFSVVSGQLSSMQFEPYILIDKESCSAPCTIKFTGDASKIFAESVSYIWHLTNLSTGSGVIGFNSPSTFNSPGKFRLDLNVYSAQPGNRKGIVSKTITVGGAGSLEEKAKETETAAFFIEPNPTVISNNNFSLDSVRTQPNPFDNNSQTTKFVAEGTGIAKIKVDVLDMSGHPVFGTDFVSGTVFDWNGRKSSGELLAYGFYHYNVIAINGDSSKNAHKNGTLTISPPFSGGGNEGQPSDGNGSGTPPGLVAGQIALEPGQSAKIIVRVLGVNPPAAKAELQIGLVAGYTDQAGLSNKVAESHQKAKLVLANAGTGKFNVKLKLKEQTACIGWGDVYGATGKSAAPRVLFDWSFTAGESEPVAINQCDKKASGEFVYCDATQFMIELLKKLHKIDAAGGTGAAALTEFQAYLMPDGFSEDFRKDFENYYKNAFFSTPSWFGSPSSPWSEYITNFERLKFEPADIAEPGLYRVKLEFSFEKGDYEFFDGGTPIAKIVVKMEKVH